MKEFFDIGAARAHHVDRTNNLGITELSKAEELNRIDAHNGANRRLYELINVLALPVEPNNSWKPFIAETIRSVSEECADTNMQLGDQTDPHHPYITLESLEEGLQTKGVRAREFQDLQGEPRYTEEQRQGFLEAAVEQYEARLTPESVDNFWQTFWLVHGDRIGRSFDVPRCDRSAEELVELRKQQREVILLPDVLATGKGLALFGNMFPEMNGWTGKTGPGIVNKDNRGGCIDIEMDSLTPNKKTTEDELRDMFIKQGRNGQTLNQYIVGSQFSYILTNSYFDETYDGRDWSRLLGSSNNRFVVDATFSRKGKLSICSNTRQEAASYLGGRSAGRKN